MKKASALESKRRSRFVKIATGDLLARSVSCAGFRSRNVAFFWFLEQLIGRIDDELDRRAT